VKAKNPSTFVISMTCFDEHDRFDPEGQARHFRRLVDAGIGVFVGGGGSGEAFTMSTPEYRDLMEVAKAELKGKVPARVMGFEPRTAKQLIDEYELTQPYGLDAFQIYSLDAGHSGAPSMRMVETYLRDVLSVIKTPCVLSSHMFAHYLIPVPMIRALCDEYPQIIGLNISTDNIGYVVAAREEMGDRVEIHVGGVGQALIALAIGAQGHLSGEANLVPKLAKSVIDYYVAGDMEKCFDAYHQQMRIFNTMGQVGGVKEVLRYLGLPGGDPRKPRLPATEEQRNLIPQWVKQMRIREIEGL
jgi:4-hydroxy-tetrahydrodipicolinate synthase